MIHTEVVLQSNRSKGLCGSFHFHAFFGFDSLVQSVRVTAAFHDMSVDHYVFVVFLEHGVSLQQLVDSMYTFRFNSVVCKQFVLFLQQLFVGQVHILQFREFCGNVRKNEQCRVFGVTGDQVDTFIGQVYTVQLFINDEVQRFRHFVHTLVVLLHVDFFRLQHTGFNALFTQELNQCFVLRQTFVAAVQGEESFFHFFLIVGCDQFFCFRQVLGC